METLLHENPEPSFEEYNTRKFIGQRLKEFGNSEIEENVGGGGIVAYLRGTSDGPTIGFRADFDALRIQEETGLPFASKYPDVMHACGHDGHTAILLSVAKVLINHTDKLSGTVKFIFHYAEEVLPGGGKAMVEAGVVDDVDAVYGLYLRSPLEFVVPTGNAVREQVGNLIEQWLIDIGVSVNHSNYDFPTWLAMSQDLDYDSGLMSYGHTVDPNVATYIQTGAPNNNNNNMAIKDSVIDGLLEQGMSGTTFDERFATYSDLQVHLQEEMPIVPLYSDSQFGVKVDGLDGGIKEYWAGSLYDLHEWTLDD